MFENQGRLRLDVSSDQRLDGFRAGGEFTNCGEERNFDGVGRGGIAEQGPNFTESRGPVRRQGHERRGNFCATVVRDLRGGQFGQQAFRGSGNGGRELAGGIPFEHHDESSRSSFIDG